MFCCADRADLVNSDNPKLTVDWNGIMVTQESYALDSADDLKLFRDWVNGGMTFAGEKVVLTGDINLSYKSWTPIGTTTTPFKGTFDGTKTKIADGKVTEVYTIRNLMVSGNDHVGLFGQVGQYGEANNVRLENLRIENVQVKANGTAGGGVSIIGCAGALAGELIGGVVNNVTVTGRVVITSSGSDVGGVVGKAYGSFTDVKVEPTDLAYVRGESTDDSHYANNVGGILGWWGENEFSMTGCVSKIEVEGPAYVGGLVGTILGGNMTISGTVEAEIKTHSPNGFGDMMGAFFGYALNNATVTVRGSSFSGSLLKESNILFTSLGNDGAGGTAYNNATLNAYDTTVQIDIAEGFDRYAVWDEGGVCSHIFRVKSAKGLANFSAIVSGSLKNCQAYSFEGETVELTEPIDLNNENFTPIGTSYSKAFAGNFNGNGNTISNLNVVGNDNNGSTRIDYLGLFGCVYTKNSAVTIESFTLRNVTVSSDVNLAGSHSAYVGAVIGQGWTQGLTLSKIKVEGTLSIEGGNTVGGFAGALSGIDVGLSVKDVEISATNGTVTSEAGVGGIVCTIPSTCKATTMESITVSGVTLVGGSGNIGGIVGSVSYKLDIKTVTLTDVIITPYNGKTATDSNPKADSEVGAVLGNWSAGYACTITGAKGNVTVRAPESENPIKATRYNNGITGINTGSNTENVTITDCDGLTVKWYED